MPKGKTTTARAPTGTNVIFKEFWTNLRSYPKEDQYGIWLAFCSKMDDKLSTLKTASGQRATGGRRVSSRGTGTTQRASGRKISRKQQTRGNRRNTGINQPNGTAHDMGTASLAD